MQNIINCYCFKIKIYGKRQISHILKIILKSDNFIVFKFINDPGNVRAAFMCFLKAL